MIDAATYSIRKLYTYSFFFSLASVSSLWSDFTPRRSKSFPSLRAENLYQSIPKYSKTGAFQTQIRLTPTDNQ